MQSQSRKRLRSPPSTIINNNKQTKKRRRTTSPLPKNVFTIKKNTSYKYNIINDPTNLNTIIQSIGPMAIRPIKIKGNENEYLFTSYTTGCIGEDRITIIRSIIILQNNPNIPWTTPNIGFYRSSGTSRENGDYRAGTFFPFYGFGYSPNELDTSGKPIKNEKFLKMSDYIKSSRHSIRELEVLEIEFNEWLKGKGKSLTLAIRQAILYEISYETIQMYFTNIWQIYCSISLCLKRDLVLGEFSLDPAFLDAHFHNCVWINTSPIKSVNYLLFLEFFIGQLLQNGITEIPATGISIIPNLYSDMDRINSIFASDINEKLKNETTEKDNYYELKDIMVENGASVEIQDLQTPGFLTFTKYQYKR